MVGSLYGCPRLRRGMCWEGQGVETEMVDVEGYHGEVFKEESSVVPC